VWRPRRTGGEVGGGVEVVVIYRQRYRDCSLPKGKVKRGEHPLSAAVREVWEETGIQAIPGPRLPASSYPVLSGGVEATKTVDFWAMRVAADTGFTPGAEVDDRRWLPLDEASDQLTYARERAVLSAFAGLRPPVPAPVILVRHAEAGSRWAARDDARPLTAEGMARARELAPILSLFAPARLISASPLRCRQTLSDLAERLRLPVEIDKHFDEGADTAAAASRLAALAGSEPALVCSQGKLIRAVLAALTAPGVLVNGEPIGDGRMVSPDTPKGAGWVLTFNAYRPRAIDSLT